jgi:hypothetical protein
MEFGLVTGLFVSFQATTNYNHLNSNSFERAFQFRQNQNKPTDSESLLKCSQVDGKENIES